MNLNKFYTIMIVPEKTSQVRRLIIPAWIVRSAAVGMAFVILLSLVMFYDYWRVMGEISENKQLKMENRRLRQQVQVFKNKVATIESTMERVKTFATRLKVITNIEDRGGLLQSLNQQQPPDSSAGLPSESGLADAKPKLISPNLISDDTQDVKEAKVIKTSATQGTATTSAPTAATVPSTAAPAVPTAPAAPTAMNDLPLDPEDPEDVLLHRDYEELDQHFTFLNHESLFVETELQDLYELLGDQKAFLSALPTRKPAEGYFSSGFGVRKSPIGGKVKMHEGVDIANRLGTSIRVPADGVVVFAAVKAGYGQTVVIDHGYGLETWYGHAKKLLVNKGQHVRRGEVIAQMGNSGRSTGPHVHYEVRVNGFPVNPISYILEN
ncbi:MAG: M23 family metallopeptidase [Bdellovibrionia bacterium]